MDFIKNQIKQIYPRIPPNERDFIKRLIGFGAIPDRDFQCYKYKSKLLIWLRKRDSKSKPHISWRCWTSLGLFGDTNIFEVSSLYYEDSSARNAYSISQNNYLQFI